MPPNETPTTGSPSRAHRVDDRVRQLAVGLVLPDSRRRDDGEVPFDVDVVRRDDDRDVGGRSARPSSSIASRSSGVEVDVAVRRDRGEDDHGSDEMRSTSSSRNRCASTSMPTCAFRGRSVTSQRSTTVRPSQYCDCRLDLDVAVQRLDERRVDHVRDRHRVVDRRAVEAVALTVELEEEVGELRDHASDGPVPRSRSACPASKSALWVTSRPIIVTGTPLREDDRGGLGVDEGVELGGRRDVALGDRAAHPDDPLEPVLHVGVALEQLRDVRERPGRDEHDARLDQLGEEVDRIRVDRRGRRLGQVGPVEPALAVHVRRRAQLRAERPVGAGCDRNIGAAGELEHLERVARRLVERLVAGDGRDRRAARPRARRARAGSRSRRRGRDRSR